MGTNMHAPFDDSDAVRAEARDSIPHATDSFLEWCKRLDGADNGRRRIYDLSEPPEVTETTATTPAERATTRDPTAIAELLQQYADDLARQEQENLDTADGTSTQTEAADTDSATEAIETALDLGDDADGVEL